MGKLLKKSKFLIFFLTLAVIFAAGVFYFLFNPSNQTQIKPVQAQTVPQISSYSGTAAHGQNIIITGSNFGIKNPAAPLAWDDCSSTNLSAIWDRTLPSQAGVPYDIAYHDNGFRNVNAPHNRIGKYISGGHAQAAYTNWNGLAGPVVVLGKDYSPGTTNFYISYYYRLDPLWPPNNGESVTDPNHKLNIFSPNIGTDISCINYLEYRPEPENARGAYHSSSMDSSGYWPESDGLFPTEPWNWVKQEVIGVNVISASAGKFYAYTDNYCGYIRENMRCYQAASIKSMSVGYYWARCNSCNPTLGSNDAFRYFADVYMDITPARVVLANNQNYSQATIVEPQIPSAWSASSITAKVNLGRLSDTGTVYLFVFDASNNHNATGYPIVLGGSPPPPPTYLLPDLTKDRTINQSDFDLFKPLWGTSQADFNSDSKTDSKDFGIMMSKWGSYRILFD